MSALTRKQFAARLHADTLAVLKRVARSGVVLSHATHEQVEDVLARWKAVLEPKPVRTPYFSKGLRTKAEEVLRAARKAKRGQDHDRIANGELADLLVDHMPFLSINSARQLLRCIKEVR